MVFDWIYGFGVFDWIDLFQVFLGRAYVVTPYAEFDWKVLIFITRFSNVDLAFFSII